MTASKVALVLVLVLVLVLCLPGCGGRTQIEGPEPVVEDAGLLDQPMSACVSMMEHPTLSCTEVCATEGKSCGGGCRFDSGVSRGDIQVAYYRDQTSCERNDAFHVALDDGQNLACRGAFSSSGPIHDTADYARCCCGVGKVVQVLSEPP